MMTKILIIDDDPVLQKVYRTKLSNEGFSVIAAMDGEEGLALMKKERPYVVLLDLIMPRKDGFQVLEEVKGDRALKAIPMIVFSNLGQESDVKKAKKLGAKDFWIKTDVSVADLVKKIRAYCCA